MDDVRALQRPKGPQQLTQYEAPRVKRLTRVPISPLWALSSVQNGVFELSSPSQMSLFKVLFRLEPQAVFGLPDGDKVVVPAGPTPKDFLSPALDTRTGHIVAHGTLSEYRREGHSASCAFSLSGFNATMRDNFVRLEVSESSAQEATEAAVFKVNVWLQAMSVQFNQRFSSEVISVEDEMGTPLEVRIAPTRVEMVAVTVYDIHDLEEKAKRSADWADAADESATKSLLYFEHASLLNEFAQTLPNLGTHAAFSRSLAFLQLYKALTTIIGDPSTDKDYQSRPKKLGLPVDFWSVRARPLYKVRNEEDVAHYSRSMPTPDAFMHTYAQAVTVYTEALTSHIAFLRRSAGEC